MMLPTCLGQVSDVGCIVSFGWYRAALNAHVLTCRACGRAQRRQVLQEIAKCLPPRHLPAVSASSKGVRQGREDHGCKGGDVYLLD